MGSLKTYFEKKDDAILLFKIIQYYSRSTILVLCVFAWSIGSVLLDQFHYLNSLQNPGHGETGNILDGINKMASARQAFSQFFAKDRVGFIPCQE